MTLTPIQISRFWGHGVTWLAFQLGVLEIRDVVECAGIQLPENSNLDGPIFILIVTSGNTESCGPEKGQAHAASGKQV